MRVESQFLPFDGAALKDEKDPLDEGLRLRSAEDGAKLDGEVRGCAVEAELGRLLFWLSCLVNLRSRLLTVADERERLLGRIRIGTPVTIRPAFFSLSRAITNILSLTSHSKKISCNEWIAPFSC